MLRGRLPGLTGGLAVPNVCSCERIFLIDCSLHSAASAIWEVVKHFLRNISRISICFQGSRRHEGDVECGGGGMMSITIRNENILVNLVYLCIIYEL